VLVVRVWPQQEPTVLRRLPQGHWPHAEAIPGGQIARGLVLRLQTHRRQAVLRRHAQPNLSAPRGMLTLARAAGAVGFAHAATGCSSTGPKVACPNAIIVPELQVVAKFGPGPGRQDTDAIYGARMTAANTTCSADKKKGGVIVASTLAVAAIRLKDDVRKGQVTYFEAVINRKQEILNERDFVIDLEWPRQGRELNDTEELETLIPLPKDASGADYAILFGFRLTPEERQYNLEHVKPPG